MPSPGPDTEKYLDRAQPRAPTSKVVGRPLSVRDHPQKHFEIWKARNAASEETRNELWAVNAWCGRLHP